MVLKEDKLRQLLKEMSYQERIDLRDFLDEIFHDLREYIDENDLAGDPEAVYPLLIEWDDNTTSEDLLYTRDLWLRLTDVLRLIREVNEKND